MSKEKQTITIHSMNVQAYATVLGISKIVNISLKNKTVVLLTPPPQF